MGVFVQQNSPLRNDFFLLFSPAIFLARPRATFCTPQLWSGTQNEDFQQWSPIDHFRSFRQKNHFFSPIKIWSKWSLKIAPKRSVLRKKLIKATLKYTDWRAFCTYWLWSGCWGSARSSAAKIVKICVFWNFWKNEKWPTLNWKISVTKVQKSKIWDDSFLAFSVAFVVVYSVFSVAAVFTEKFPDQNWYFCKFPKKTKKGPFCAAKFAP